MNFTYALLIVYLTSPILTRAALLGAHNVHYLEQDETYKFSPPPYSNRQLQIFCYQGKPKNVIHIWQSVLLKITHPTDNFDQYDGPTPEQVHQEYLDKKYSWSVNLFATKSKNMKLNPFNTSCIGLDSRDAYSVNLKVIRIDLWKVLCLVIGVGLFLSAPTLSHNTIFHYLCGVSFGICASFLILIYFISRIFPRKTLMYGVIGAGWTIVIYFLQILWDNLKVIMSTYQIYVIWYIVFTGTLSFILCYRWGPVENPKTKNLIKWTLQALGIAMIFFSSHYQEAAMGQIILLLIFTYLPRRWVMPFKRKKRFPPKITPLSNDEYYEQGVRETAKALSELREFCSSPQCNQWKTALKIKDVKRFASFMEGNSHLSDEEILEYETSIRGELTDDSTESEMSEDESS
ncbi:nuclear envelope integral membrane protein 1 isoform X2 [Anthonomus grandis grandis]|uniref:nuclear envelope integral membrane protein 1 isoform X2 n=1 Tax=Anthonomus grandis grandis TaxID=2921223 RepID=UPI0021658EB4|nr:nuclear envelope integral membrane protein 1 isoform X2 [Anthonomus grandis grandis]